MNWTRVIRTIVLEIYIHNEILLARDARRETSESCSICSSRANRALAASRRARIELDEQPQLSRPNPVGALVIFGLARNIISLLQELVLKRLSKSKSYLLSSIVLLMRRHRHVSFPTKSPSCCFRNCTIRCLCCHVLRSLYLLRSQLYCDEIFLALKVLRMCSFRKVVYEFLVKDFE